MDNVGAVELPFDPAELLWGGALRGLELGLHIMNDFPWPVKLGVAIVVCVRLCSPARGSQRPRRH